ALADDLRDRKPVDEHVEHRALDLVRVPALAHRQVALRIEIDQEHAVALLGEGDAEVQRRGRLGDPALLVRERADSGQFRTFTVLRPSVRTWEETSKRHGDSSFGSS